MLTDVKTMLTAVKRSFKKKDRSVDLFYYGRNYATLLSFLLNEMYTFL